MSLPLRTCLSPGVHQIVCVDGVSSTRDDGQCLTDQGTFNWTYLQNLLPAAEDTPDYYRVSVQKLSPVFAYVQSRFGDLSPDEFEAQFSKHLRWTSNSAVLCGCFKLLQEKYHSRAVISLLLSTAVLERALGNVYLLQGKQCPSLLKDILVTKELDVIFGPSVIQILRILIGPPISLNLRNLVWHGFTSPEDINQQYSYFLLMMIASLGEVLNESGVSPDDIKRRPQVNFNLADRIVQIFGELTLPDREIYIEMCTETEFILPQFVPVWEDVFDLFGRERYGECVAILFPLMENGLRQMFALVNNCPERILTAESSVLYTTFDEMLSRALPDGTKNLLLSKLGQSIVDMLQDLMVYSSGPRFRDRLGHGEAVFTDISRDQGRTVLLVALTLVQHFTSEDKVILQTPWCVGLAFIMSSYISVFHLVSLLIGQMDELCASLSTWPSVVQYSPDLMKVNAVDENHWLSSDDKYTDLHGEVCAVGYRVLHEIERNCGCVTGQQIDEFFHMDNRIPLLVQQVVKSEVVSILRLSMSSNGSPVNCSTVQVTCEETRTHEMVNLLRRMMTECVHVSSNVIQVTTQRQQQLENKQLRSRQRETFKRQLTSLPYVSLGLRLVLLITLQQLSQTSSSNKCSRHDIKFLKSALQYCENLRTYTSMEKNKWLESIDITQKFVERTKNVVQ